jgi:acyl-CoA thioester hydrolase
MSSSKPSTNPAVSETRLRVRYAETDQMGVVYYANYIVWMEVGRVDLCKACGFDYRDMEAEDGIYLAVAEAQCRYRSPARFDDEVVVRTWIEHASTRMVTFAYEMLHADTGRRLATGTTRHVFVSRTMRPTHLPAKYHALFGIAEPAAGA